MKEQGCVEKHTVRRQYNLPSAVSLKKSSDMKRSVDETGLDRRLTEDAGATTKARLAIGAAKHANRESNPVILVIVVILAS